MLNASCASHRLQSSPVCGVCDDGYYSIDGGCYACQFDGSEASIVSTVLFLCAIIMCFVILYTVLWLTSSNTNTIDFGFKTKQEVTVEESCRESSRTTSPIALIADQKFITKAMRGSGMTAKLVLSFIQVYMRHEIVIMALL